MPSSNTTFSDALQSDLALDDEKANLEKQWPYIGWVPSLLGDLSYEAVGLDGTLAKPMPSIPAVIKAMDFESGQINRYVIVSGRVDWKDENRPGCSGDFDVYMTYSGHFEELTLFGEVYILPTNSAKVSAHEEVKGEILRFTSRLEYGAVQKDYERLRKCLKDQADACGGFSFSFRLQSCGLIAMRPGSAFPPGLLTNQPDTVFVLGKQAYYFVKYALHRHQHHRLDMDSLTTLHQIKDLPPDEIGLYLLRDLAIAVIDLKRGCAFESRERLTKGDLRGLEQLGGIVAYARSLAVTLEAEKFFSDAQSRRQLQYWDNVSKSIERRTAEIKLRLEAHGPDFQRNYGFWYGLLGVPCLVFWAIVLEYFEKKSCSADVLFSMNVAGFCLAVISISMLFVAAAGVQRQLIANPSAQVAGNLIQRPLYKVVCCWLAMSALVVMLFVSFVTHDLGCVGL